MTAENTKLSGVNPKLAAKGLIKRATSPVLTSDKEEKRMILPTTLNFTVRRDKLRIYTLQNPPEVFSKFAPSGGYTECAVMSFA